MVHTSKTCNLINWEHRQTFLICDNFVFWRMWSNMECNILESLKMYVSQEYAVGISPGHIWIPWRKQFENFWEFSQNFKIMSFNTNHSFILKMIENWILKMTENKYRINSIIHNDSSDDYDIWESLWYCTDVNNAFLVIRADFRMCKTSTCVTKSKDTVVYGNSIWQELVTVTEAVWP
jgi:hypothetical protein